MRLIQLTGLVALLAGCDDKITAADTGTTDWWEGSDGSTTDGDDEDGDDEDGEDDEDDEEYGEIFWGEVSPSEGFTAVGYYHATQAEGVLCDMDYTATATAESTCTDCSTSYSFSIDTVDFAEGSGCDSSPYGGLEGTTLLVGVSGETLYMNDGSGWATVADGYAEAEDGEFFFEIGTMEESEDDEDDEEEDDDE